MTRRRVGILVAVAVLVGLGLAAWTVFGTEASRFADSPLIGRPMPVFTLPDVDTGQATAVGPDGQVLVVNFWAPWCVPCQTEHPLLNRLAQAYAGQPVRFVGVTYDSRLADSTAFLDQAGRGIHNLNDADGRVSVDYGVVGVPETFFIGADGRVAARVIGPVDEALVRQQLDRLLAATTQKVSRTQLTPSGSNSSSPSGALWM